VRFNSVSLSKVSQPSHPIRRRTRTNRRIQETFLRQSNYIRCNYDVVGRLACAESCVWWRWPQQTFLRRDQRNPTDARIRLGVGISPNLGAVSVSSTVLVTLTNQNPSSTQTLEPGDSFTVSFDLGDGSITSLPDSVITSSNALAPNFFTHQSRFRSVGDRDHLSGARRRPFLQVNGIAFKIPLQAPSTVRNNRVTVQVPADPRYANGAGGAVTPWSSVDFVYGCAGSGRSSGTRGTCRPGRRSLGPLVLPMDYQDHRGRPGSQACQGREAWEGPAGSPGFFGTCRAARSARARLVWTGAQGPPMSFQGQWSNLTVYSGRRRGLL